MRFRSMIAAMRQCFDAGHGECGTGLGLEHYGLDVGCHADFVLLQARDPEKRMTTTSSRSEIWFSPSIVEKQLLLAVAKNNKF